MYNTTDSARVIQTGCRSFQYGYRFFDTVIASDDPITIDGERWRQNLLATSINGQPVFGLHRDYDRAALNHDLAIPAYASYLGKAPMAQPLQSCRNILTRDVSLAPVTDDNMGTEWRYLLGLD